MHMKYKGMAYGAFDNRRPVLMLRDPQLIKQIMIKDFDHFVNRSDMFEGDENLFSSSLITMKDDTWREMRNTLSPAFTGRKMRQMFELMLEKQNEAMIYLKDKQGKGEDGFALEVKDFTTRLTHGIIASTAFGLQVNSFRDEDNEFYRRAKKAVNFDSLGQLKAFFTIIFPKLAKLLKIELFDKDFSDYFMRLVLDTMKYRAENNIRRADMIDLLMEAKGMIPNENSIKAQHREWSDLQVVAQCFLFFFAALEPLSGVMSFALHELMEYPDVQEKLYEEVQENNDQLEGKQVTYDVLHKMPYMDMVVSEVLRKWPVALVADRTCTKDYVYESPVTKERLEIRKGDIVRASMVGLHHDPNNFPDPDTLNPERFSEENKSLIENGAYFPFGLGPRNCIGNRFALLAIKAFLYNIIRDYRLEVSDKTCLPLELDKKTFQLRPVGGFWIQFKPRH
uniref:Cytochrome P450 n=2 Tax=Musca domestica TaxID=7370 RepID=T1PH25_MUSDO